MNTVFRIFCFSAVLVFVAWIAKMHFMPGGDYLFRTGTIGILITLVWQVAIFSKKQELKVDRLNGLFIINSIGLFIVYSGMMMKVSHLMNSQFEKDLVMDFIGIPIMLVSAIYTFKSVQKFFETSMPIRVLFLRHVVFPWLVFLFSFMLYSVYSVILARK